MGFVISTFYYSWLIFQGSSILAIVIKFLISLSVISCDWLTNGWIMLHSIVSNWFENNTPFRIFDELMNGMNELSSYLFMSLSTTMNPPMVLSPLMFTIISNGGKSLINIYSMVF